MELRRSLSWFLAEMMGSQVPKLDFGWFNINSVGTVQKCLVESLDGVQVVVLFSHARPDLNLKHGCPQTFVHSDERCFSLDLLGNKRTQSGCQTVG